jgi:hypothetical protein
MTKESSPVLYRERTLPSLGFYAAALFIPVAMFVIALPFSVEIGFVVAALSIPLMLVASWALSPLIELTADHLRVGRIEIETKYLGSATAIEGHSVFLERGPHLDTRAFTKFQVGVKQLVKIEIQDKQDPTPYWLVATRNPEILAGLINKL